MAKPDAATLRADPKAAAQLPADDPGAHEHLHATPKHPRLLRLRAGRAAAADPPAAHPAVDAAGPPTAADLPTAGSTAAAGLPADGAGVDEHLHADVQHPQLLPAGGDEACPGRYARNRAASGKRREKEDQKEKLRAIFFLATRNDELLQGRGLTAPALLMPSEFPRM